MLIENQIKDNGKGYELTKLKQVEQTYVYEQLEVQALGLLVSVS